MIFRQLFDQPSSTYTYLLADERTHEAVLIDPVFEQHARDAALTARSRPPERSKATPVAAARNQCQPRRARR